MKPDLNILIVEDELVLQLMLEHMLKKMGFSRYEKVTKGQSAVLKCNEADFDLILMDIMLQDDIDGIEAYRRINEVKDIPVIYITGNTDPKNKERAAEIGYHDYIGKPITYSQLKRSIQRLFEIQEG
ncbi:MAG: response regulator [Balneolaceae bacterium]|nr:response regulator [Balneolaceae bacterium]